MGHPTAMLPTVNHQLYLKSRTRRFSPGSIKTQRTLFGDTPIGGNPREGEPKSYALEAVASEVHW